MSTAALAQAPVYYTKHIRGVTVFINGKSAAISNDAPTYPRLLEALRRKDWEAVLALCNVKSSLVYAAKLAGTRIIIDNKDNMVYTAPNGTKQVLKGPLIERAIAALHNGATAETIMPIMKFMDNVCKNKLKDIRDELYEFLSAGKMPLTKDGCFLAYKRVRDDYKDCHSGTMDNSPGKVVSMPQREVDSNRNNECSRGLHFCARSYLASFGGARTMIVKVNPRHVFAIPRDYSFAKGRASEYFVVGECKGNATEQEHFLASYVFDENAGVAAPDVAFVPQLKAGVNAMAEGYGLVVKGKVFMRVATTKGELEANKRTVVKKVGAKYVSAITGQDVPAEHVREFAVTTKSVRPALVRAVARARNS